jgi:hypothetical protein
MKIAKINLMVAMPDAQGETELKDFIKDLMAVHEWYEEGVAALKYKVVSIKDVEDPCDPGIGVTPWSLEQPPEPEIDWTQAEEWMDQVGDLLQRDLDNDPDNESTRQRLAEYAHDAWSGWMKYLFDKSTHNGDGTVTIPAWAVERWTRQATTPYMDLPESEQKSDLVEADRMLEITRTE